MALYFGKIWAIGFYLKLLKDKIVSGIINLQIGLGFRKKMPEVCLRC